MTNIQKKYYFLKNQLKNIENSIINFFFLDINKNKQC